MSASLLRSVAGARVDHDATCRYGGSAVRVHFNPSDAARLGVEGGEDLCGLTAVLDEKVGVGRMRVYCDVELDGQGLVGNAVARPVSPAFSPTPVGA